MALKLSTYLKIFDKCCLSYRGPCEEYAVLLRALRPSIEKTLEIHVYLSCRPEAFHWLGNERVIPLKELDQSHQIFGLTLELVGDGRNHPIELLIEQNKIPIEMPIKKPVYSRRCLIVSPLSNSQIKNIKSHVEKEGFVLEQKSSIEEVDWVIGEESPLLFEAARLGIRTTLIPTGIGTSLYSKMFQGEIRNFNI